MVDGGLPVKPGLTTDNYVWSYFLCNPWLAAALSWRRVIAIRLRPIFTMEAIPMTMNQNTHSQAVDSIATTSSDDRDGRGALAGQSHEPHNEADQLAYLADLAGELSEIAERLRCPTLAGLLVLAQTEANLQMRRR
jgi:hypothetical protein